MPLDYDRLINWPFSPIEQEYNERDTMLYALGVGLGMAPLDRSQLRFVYEQGLLALPTMAAVLGHPGLFLADPATGVDWKQMLHGEQSLTLLRPLPASGRVVSHSRVDAVIDKGEGRGALVYTTRETRDRASGDGLAVQSATAFCRADGGFGGPSGPIRPVHTLPDRQSDFAVELPTLKQAALIYRLSGDRNPLHADPAVAETAGFPAPILHGLCTFGVAGHALLRAICDYDPTRLRRIDVRFSRPVFPGETIKTDIWLEEPGRAGFRCTVPERGVTVIDNGYCEYTPR
jgi:acyl dehydratase